MNKYLTVVFVAMILLCAFAPTPAKANSIDTFVFQTCGALGGCLPGTSSNPVTYTWQAPSSPIPTSYCQFPFPACFSITADVTANGTNLGPTPLQFWGVGGLGGPGGFTAYTPNPLVVLFNTQDAGPVVWSGTNSSPTFTLGTYSYFPMGPTGPEIGTLTISTTTSVPEPSTLLLTGAGLLGGLAVIAFWRREPASTTCS